MSKWLDRVRDWTSVQFKDPDDRAERAMVRVLLLAAAAVAFTGLADIIRARNGLTSVQFAAGIALVVAAVWMDRTGRPYPRTILVIGSLAAYGWIVFIVRGGDRLRLTDASATVIIAFTGVLALVLGGKWVRWVIAYWSILIVAAVATVRWPITGSVAHTATDSATVLLMTGLTAVAVMTMRRVALQGKGEYQRLLETVPVAVVELNAERFHELLRDLNITSTEQMRDSLASGELRPEVLVESVQLVPYNDIAERDLSVESSENQTLLKHALLSGSSRDTVEVLGNMLFDNASGSAELSLGPDRTVHRVINWKADPGNRQKFIVTATDITAQKAAEQALAEEIEYKDEFIASVSHELRTPLTAVVGLVDEMARVDSPIDAAERDDLLTIVAEQSHEVADIVEDLLVAAQAAGGNLAVHPISIDLSSVVGSTMELSEGEFRCEIVADVHAFADPARVRQIARNLASNAIRHGGERRRICLRQTREQAVVEVRDNGPAIPDSLQQTMFEPYERTQQLTATTPESVGLGLTVARSLARSMGGELKYEHDGNESSFRLTLPANPPG